MAKRKKKVPKPAPKVGGAPRKRGHRGRLDRQRHEVQARTMPFVLSCVDCDMGQGIECADDARRDGWMGLIPDPKGMNWTWLGTCPECWAKMGRDEQMGLMKVRLKLGYQED